MSRTSIRSRRGLAAVAFAAFAIGGVFFAADAQEISTAAPASVAATPLDLTTINVAAADDQKKSETAREPLFTIDANVSNQFPLGSDQKIKPGNTTNQIVFGGTARLHVSPGFALFYRRLNHDNISGATNGTGFGSWGYDIESDIGVEYVANRNLRFESFWKYRYRTCCPNAADGSAFSATSKTPAGPRAERGYMTSVAWRFGPNTRIGRSFMISEEAQWYDHHLDSTIANNPAFIKAGNTLGGLTNGSDSTLLWETHVYYYMSIYGQKKVVPYIGFENKPSYFDNATQPGFQNRVRYGALIHLSPMFSLDAYVKNDHSYPASASAAHNSTLFTDLLIHLKS
jgi:hypothetical protein